tara:strand:- start:65 stop:481 length:417 start_codon:yes stop_codon:yes gene_type:complete
MEEALKNYIVGGSIAVIFVVVAALLIIQVTQDGTGDHLLGNAVVSDYSQTPIYDKSMNIVGYVVLDKNYDSSSTETLTIDGGVNGYTTKDVTTTGIIVEPNGKTAIDGGVNGYEKDTTTTGIIVEPNGKTSIDGGVNG